MADTAFILKMLPPPRSTLFPYTTLFRSCDAEFAEDSQEWLSHWGNDVSGMRAGMRVKKLIGDVSENGGASRRDAAFGDQSEETGEKLAEIDSGREFRKLREEIGGEVFRIVVQLEGSGGLGQVEMVRTKAKVRLRASEAATLPIGVAIYATSVIVEGNAGRFWEKRGTGILFGWIHH